MSSSPLCHHTVCSDSTRIALALPLGEAIAALHRDAMFPLDEDPRTTSRALILGMMVLRPAAHAWNPQLENETLPASLQPVSDWCYDVEGIGGSWPISAGNVFDAYRLALQYGTVDAVLAGSRTVVREGIACGNRRAHLWQPYTPLSWAALRPYRDLLEPAIAAVRRHWRELGVLSARTYPAQIAVTGSGEVRGADVLDARIFHERHPDGSAIEAYLLTSEAGADSLRRRARARQLDIERLLLVASPPGRPAAIDVARVPALLRSTLDARVVEHDGGATSLAAFLESGAVSQLNLTLMRSRSVHDVVRATDRIDRATREHLLASWEPRPRLFPPGGSLPPAWRPFHAVAQDDGEAVAVSFDVRAG